MASFTEGIYKRAERQRVHMSAKPVQTHMLVFLNTAVTALPAHDEPCRDWMQKYEGASQVALLPQTTQQVSQVRILQLSRCKSVQFSLGGLPERGMQLRPLP